MGVPTAPRPVAGGAPTFAGGASSQVGLGPQGGDPRARRYPVVADLSTCVCAYGPPSTALDALQGTSAETLSRHPYQAADDLRAAYASYLGVAPLSLAVARGASELIWQLAASRLGRRVVLPLPAYTEYRQAFATAPTLAPESDHHGLDAIGSALGDGDVVLLSNPHNPSGRAFEAAELAAVASANPAGVLVVDESYVEFCAEPSRWSLIGCEVGNVVVLRSPSKFFGLAGARVGVAWSPRADLVEAFEPQRGSWPVSAIEVAPVVAALADVAWAHANRARLQDDVAWLDAQLRPMSATVEGAVTHFRLLRHPDAIAAAERTARCGVALRVVGEGHGLAGPALRVTAPPADLRVCVAEALRLL